MKKISIAFVFCFALLRASADEGMWLPLLLGQQVYDDMVKHGLKLTKEQLYNINKPSIKDAVIIFGGGCTGEIVSNQGLIFTNHHCGYGVIAGSSTVEHNYLKDGFYAYTKDQEIKSDLTVTFLERIEDVTDQVESQLKGLDYAARAKKLNDVYKEITDKVLDTANGISGKVYSMFKGNQYILYVYKIYKDIRLVGAPPESMGKFGGDTDNWEWPRHTCDYSIFRVYTAKDGKPATYSPDNIPLKPKYFLPVSLKGYTDGSFAMIFGYPGGTNRYETSYGIKLKTEIDNPSLVGLRDVRLKFMHAQMIKDPAVKLKLAENYASIANYWKFYDGETKQLEKHHVYDNKLAAENKFAGWAKGKPEYENVLSDYAKNYEAWTPYAKERVYLIEGVLGSPLADFAASLVQVNRALTQQGKTDADVQKALAAEDAERTKFLAEEDIPIDKKILAATAMMYYTDIDKSQHPIGFYEAIRDKYGSPDDEATFTKWANDVFASTMILDSAKWNAFMKNPDAVTLQGDPAYAYAAVFIQDYLSKYAAQYADFTAKNNELGRLYMKGIMEMDPAAAKKMYPDANFSMRVTYGNVKSYNPRDAVHYDYETTEKGVLEKYIPGDYEFDLPQKVIDLLKKRDFGQYIDKKRNDLVTDFITTDDITGGNSGSPVIDGNGNLIGLAFDGNYEALSHKIQFDKDLNRTICVDIRYVLWCIDKAGGAKNIIDELKLVR
ncbi:MAG TPA: S46 family peptidase [Chitinophagaceae bacterium]|nr:S46 family peptidase [Chitinophagaceae bacterium]